MAHDLRERERETGVDWAIGLVSFFGQVGRGMLCGISSIGLHVCFCAFNGFIGRAEASYKFPSCTGKIV